MREKGAMQACADRAAKEINAVRGAGRRFRIWSAGCASGEEPYSLALLLTQRGLTARDFEIIGSDISDRALARAREATYTVHSFRFLDEAFKASHFTANPTGTFTLREPWRSMVTFTGVNLYADPRLPLFGQYDAIFCRNVLIYFDNESKLAVLRNLHARLRDDGQLFIGSSESLLTIDSPFRLGRLGGEFAYIK
jgi:chemotaxis protein methyltransferase CheR